MATTKDRIEALNRGSGDIDRLGAEPETDRTLERLWAEPAHRPTRTRAPAAPLRRLRLGGQMSPAWALAVALGWVAAVIVVEITVPPPPPATLAPDPFFVVALNTIWNLAFFGALAGAAARRRWGLAASAVGAVLALGLAVACPVSGHHESVGLWWGLELAAFGGLAALSFAGLRRNRA
jgi:hypothetical protein